MSFNQLKYPNGNLKSQAMKNFSNVFSGDLSLEKEKGVDVQNLYAQIGELKLHFPDACSGHIRHKHRENVTLLGCAAHCRREFEHAKENDAKRSRQALTLFARLYQIEARAREANLSFDERLEQRNKHSLEVLYELKTLLESWRMQLLPKSPIGVATAYTLKIWERLERTLTNGMYEIDNNLIENRIRPLVLGRKNYRFAGSHDGASCNAMMYSFFACCKIVDINPYQWLTDVINRIPEHKANRLDVLLPHYWIILQRLGFSTFLVIRS